jgi:xanthosine utilization system XapX-like protein
VLIAGIGLDVIFQLIALRALYPIEAVLVGFLLVALPYQIVRTVVARLASKS